MSMSQYESFSDYKAGILAVPSTVDKPVVDILEAQVINWGPHKILIGMPLNHPREHLNGKEIRSSAVVKVEDTSVETRNTRYNVLSWYKDGA